MVTNLPIVKSDLSSHGSDKFSIMQKMAENQCKSANRVLARFWLGCICSFVSGRRARTRPAPGSKGKRPRMLRRNAEFSGDPPLPVARLTPATGHRVNFLPMKKTILVADDDPAVRRMLCRVLAGENYDVLAARDGQEAVEMCRADRVDLVLLDLSLPLKNGWEILERLSAENPCVPVIIITAQPNQIFPALASGVGALMEKPLDLPKLLRTIHELLEEPPAGLLARMEGRPAEFHYLPPQRTRPS